MRCVVSEKYDNTEVTKITRVTRSGVAIFKVWWGTEREDVSFFDKKKPQLNILAEAWSVLA
ncbi:hypothetical protein CWN93_00465 [Vibrio splendidus]|nr:hypothetical protein CWN93_00465 [Vibrio splendidus]